ncbi:Aldolase-type TIM barrel [Penicillium taxi]|uniref:Aldolase-type TIM barrel n=1 Tax=Penicillium taxi TaxID=168475 RepID=UPI0025456BD9|nr:Aldolase-type TIM barrel [Penicillium taxi]KAJ5894532.1 Aldolase-type TIM barrel [Penicillium taxi]
MSNLFKPLRVGRIEVSNRIVLAPLTRCRNDDKHIPLFFVKDYYAQRGSTPGTLLISEGALITPRAGLWDNSPEIHTDAQVAMWKEVTDAVHAKGSYIYMQIFAMGRVASHEQLKKEDNFDLVSSSATPLCADGPIPRALSESEIEEYIADYVQAARNAISAGFDGVEIHSANGFLLDQFLQDTCNKRTDCWGGSIQNRVRFTLEVTRAVAAAIGADRTGIRLSPFSPYNGMKMENPLPTFKYLAQELRKLKIAYTHLIESRVSGAETIDALDSLDFFLKAYEDASPVIVAGGYKSDSAREAVDIQYRGHDILVAFGRPFISNPDLPFRIKDNVKFAPYDRDTFYTPGTSKGYTDYEFSDEFKAKAAAIAA